MAERTKKIKKAVFFSISELSLLESDLQKSHFRFMKVKGSKSLTVPLPTTSVTELDELLNSWNVIRDLQLV